MDEPKKVHPNLKPWKKGQPSANPSGRPKKFGALVVRCTAAVDEFVVSKWINEVKTKGKDWVECSKLLAAYGYGKPVNNLSISATVQAIPLPPELSLEELRALAKLPEQREPHLLPLDKEPAGDDLND
jgi:hypothetical protein